MRTDRRRVLRALATAPVALATACVADIESRRPRPTGRDDTDAVQRAIDGAITRHRGGAVSLPAGTFRIARSLLIRDVLGLRFTGESEGATVLEWHGPDDAPMFLLQDVRDSAFADFSIQSSPSRPLHTAMQTENGPGGLYAPSQNLFENLGVDGTGKGGLDYGFRIARGAGGDANNEFHEFVRCKVRNYRIAWSIEHSQSHTNRFYSCSFNGNRNGEAGVRTTHGSFSWYGGGGGGNMDADFVLGSANVTITILNGNFEDSARLLKTDGPSGARWPIQVQGVRFSAGRLHPDGVMIDVRYPGPLILKHNLFGASSLPRMPRVRLTSNARGNSFISHGNLWAGRDALAVSPYIFAGGGRRSLNASIEGDSFDDGDQARDVTVLRDGDEAPTVHASRWFRTRNGAPTVIGDFRNGWPGERFSLLIDDDNTAIDFTRPRLSGNGGRLWRPRRGATLDCLFDGEIWRCSAG